jgi:hypothetical protein
MRSDVPAPAIERGTTSLNVVEILAVATKNTRIGGRVDRCVDPLYALFSNFLERATMHCRWIAVALTLTVALCWACTGSSEAQSRLADARVINGLEVTGMSPGPQRQRGAEFRLVFHNVSVESLRLPGPIDPPDVTYWRVVVRDRDTGAAFTGVAGDCNCARVESKFLVVMPALRPSERQTAVVSVSSFGFVAGAMSYSAARQRRFEDAAGRSDRAFDPQ